MFSPRSGLFLLLVFGALGLFAGERLASGACDNVEHEDYQSRTHACEQSGACRSLTVWYEKDHSAYHKGTDLVVLVEEYQYVSTYEATGTCPDCE